jgi:flagellar P-ring protein precursor FlgI
VVGRVVIDERTGTIAVGANVTLGPCAIAHGGITVQVAERPGVSQPAPFGRGQTTTVPETQVDVEEAGGRLAPLAKATTVADVAAALNALGLKPRDLVAVFQALKVAGALRAELQVM